MSEQIRLPGITGSTDSEKLQQIRSYLYQLADQLNRTLQTLSAPTGSDTTTEDVSVAFARLRPLIIESSEIAAAIGQRLKGTFPTREQVLHMESCVWDTVSEQVVESSLESQPYDVLYQNFLVFGTYAGSCVLASFTAVRGSGILYTGNLTPRDAGPGKFALPGVPGDRMTILSDKPFKTGDE